MTSRLMTSWCRRGHPGSMSRAAEGGIAPTRTLDWRAPDVQSLLADLHRGHAPDAGGQDLLRAAHRLVATRVRPVYALDEAQPVSRTLHLGRGSCSQRLAILEAVARAEGIPTRVRGLLVNGRFWYPRFPRLHVAVPDAVLLAWPEFHLDEEWISASELFGPVGSLSRNSGFTNADEETLFDAVSRTAVDWDGRTSTPGTCSACDLSAYVREDLGRFDSRDDLFAHHGQTLCWPARTLGAPILGRWSAWASFPAA